MFIPWLSCLSRSTKASNNAKPSVGKPTPTPPTTYAHVIFERWPLAKRMQLSALLNDPVMLDAIGTLQVRAAQVTPKIDAARALAAVNHLNGYMAMANDLVTLSTPTDTQQDALQEWEYVEDDIEWMGKPDPAE